MVDFLEYEDKISTFSFVLTSKPQDNRLTEEREVELCEQTAEQGWRLGWSEQSPDFIAGGLGSFCGGCLYGLGERKRCYPSSGAVSVMEYYNLDTIFAGIG